MPATVLLSSVGVSGALILDWVGAKTTTAAVTLGSTTMTVSGTLQATLDSSAASGVAAVWFQASSIAVTSAAADTGAFYTFLTPIAGLRLSSTAISSSSLTLRALQNAGG